MNETTLNRANERIGSESLQIHAKSVSEDAFMALLQVHQTQLLGFIFCLVHHFPDAEDVFQKTALTAWEKFDDFETGTDFLAWTKTIARNNAIAFLRDSRRERTRFSEALVEEIAQRPLWTEAGSAARLIALRKCRLKLSSQDQVLLRECYGATSGKFQDAAVTLGRTVDSIYVSLSRIRRVLSECIRRALAQEELSR